jgi:predicted dehydrogenase
MSSSVSRRRFLHGLGVAAVAPLAAPSVLAQGRKLRHASFGANGMAWADIRGFSSHPAFELVAVADADLSRTANVKKQFPNAKIYQDWRELLRVEGPNLDTVNVSTPDHMHAPIALAAMAMDKHVYLQKPMALTVRETRLLAQTARDRRLVTQMGIQTSSDATQIAAEAMVRSGVIGKVRAVHTFCNKTWGDLEAVPKRSDAVPDGLDWDGWIGVGEKRPYVKDAYHPGQWRKRIGFGTGTLGDMGCHIFSPPMRALGLHIPTRISSFGAAGVHGNWPVRSRIQYVFPGTGLTAGDTLDFWWYDGEEPVPQDVVAQVGGKVPPSGSIFLGTEGVLLLPHIGEPALFPAEKFAARAKPTVTARNHWHEFLDAALKGPGTRTSAGFDYAQLVTEVVLLGTIASHYPEVALDYDPAIMRFTSHRDANAWFTRRYRKHYLMTAI